MKQGDRIAFWYRGEIHAGRITAYDPDIETVMLQCSTIDYDSVMVRREDILEEEDEDEGF